MATKTIYLVQGYTAGPRGRISPMPAIEAASAAAAISRAERLAERKGGALALSRVGDTDLNEFEDPVILGRFGKVPDEV